MLLLKNVFFIGGELRSCLFPGPIRKTLSSCLASLDKFDGQTVENELGSPSSPMTRLNFVSRSHQCFHKLATRQHARLRPPYSHHNRRWSRIDHVETTNVDSILLDLASNFPAEPPSSPTFAFSSTPSNESKSHCLRRWKWSSTPDYSEGPRDHRAHSRRYFHSSMMLKRRRSFRSPRIIEKKPIAEVWRGITVRELARAIDLEPDEVLEALSNVTSADHRIYEVNTLQYLVKASIFRCRVVQRYDVPAESSTCSDLDAVSRPPLTPEESLLMPRRHPVVTIMGHVDHGKTTLLDRLRKTNVVSQEFGGITQHIGAFSVTLASGARVTFLDTPGHAAFSSMRGRGANVTDIVVLVVAAEDGVMNQTLESIEHAQSAGVAVVVAINKIDRPEADVAATKRGLTEAGVNLEEFGGDVICVPISALKGTNVNQLIEALIAQAELLDLRADPTGFVEGTVIETRQVDGCGKLATILVQRGILKTSAFLVAGDDGAECKVKNLYDSDGKILREAKPFEPVEVMGWKDLPNPGDKVLQVANQKRLNQVVLFRKNEKETAKFLEAQKLIEKQKELERQIHQERFANKVALSQWRPRIKDFRREKETSYLDTSSPMLNVILRGDVDGSLEAILDVFDTYKDDKCKLDVINFGVGPPTPTDINMATSFKCIIYCFNLKIPKSVEELAQTNGVEIFHFNIIYRLFEHMRNIMTASLPPLYVDEVIGTASVMQPFVITDEKKKKRPVAGSQCTKGELQKDENFKLIRTGDVIYDGPLFALKHFKDDVKSISQGMDCGIAFDDVEAQPESGDIIQCYRVREDKQEITWNLDF